MDEIRLHRVCPEFFTSCGPASEVWLQEVIFRKGERYLVEAASGSGKSTLCGYLYGARTDYAGTICFDGRDIVSFGAADWTAVRRNSLGIVFQDLRLFPELTALENVMLKNELTDFRTEREIFSFFEISGLGDKTGVASGKLSFGQQQRVALIRVLCQPFDFILLDEPVSHLDHENNRIMGELLTREAARQGAGIVVTSTGKRLETHYHKIIKL